jgi:hypothetical protein
MTAVKFSQSSMVKFSSTEQIWNMNSFLLISAPDIKLHPKAVKKITGSIVIELKKP